MTTVLVAGEGICNASCYDAQGPDCTCVCDGVLHGVGRARAVELAPILVAAGRPVVAVLELPLGEGAGNIPDFIPAPVADGPRCIGCGRPESEAPGFIWYGDGPACSGCRHAALELRERRR